ncbi:putative protein YaaQ [Koleobacter methoxysyntrophicus]|jgi:uncharacterized protein YaaQ|uniref:Uncharacterized protein n=2 Tax=Koleobacter methoxysyntrophicus TaxID=2751313 RepID=A0A8A0RLT1_9FIRM|nr:putative protein YaaQ [Koleobacter methoxysyntrophicus]
MMKLIIAVIQDKDAPKLIEELMENNFGVTKMASTGGFLKSGNTTLMIGVEDEKVDDVISIIDKKCKSRKQVVAPLPLGGPGDSYVPYPIEVNVGGATIFVLNVERFEKI